MVKPYQSGLRYSRLQSEVHDISSGDLLVEVRPSFVHSFAGIVFYNDSGGVTAVQPSAGTVTYSIRTELQPHVFQTFPSNLINADTPDQVDWASNTLEIKAEFLGIVGATHARLIWTGNSA